MHTIAMGRASAMPRNRRKVNELNSFTINCCKYSDQHINFIVNEINNFVYDKLKIKPVYK